MAARTDERSGRRLWRPTRFRLPEETDDPRLRLEHGIHPRFLRIQAPLLDALATAFRALPASSLGMAGEGLAAALAVFLAGRVDDHADRMATLRRDFATFSARHARTDDQDERRALILDYARCLGATARRVRGDRRAFRRWFGYDALVDRFRRRVAAEERRAAFTYDRLGTMAALVLAGRSDDEAGRLWRRLGVETAAARLMEHRGDERVRVAAFRALATALAALPEELQEGMVGETTLLTLYRTAFDPSRDVWSQTEALGLLRTLSPDAFGRALRARLSDPQSGDDLFVRRRAVRLLCGSLERRADLVDLVPVVRADPSPAVRQVLAEGLGQAPWPVLVEHFPPLIEVDPAPEVRAAALVALPSLLRWDRVDWIADRLGAALRSERDRFVLRAALTIADRCQERLSDRDEAEGRRWLSRLEPELERLHAEASSLAVRRWAAQTRERMWCRADPDARRLRAALTRAVRGLAEGESRRLWRGRHLLAADPELAGRVLATMAQDDVGYELALGRLAPRLTRGDRFRFRLWRFLHEYRHPSPDKRQAFPHVIGRVYSARVAAPSATMAELAETKVPGEPLFMPDEAGWRPYLPLVDHALSAIDTGGVVRLYTAEGVTEMEPPRGLAAGVRARLELTRRFARYADQRNWTEQRNQPPSTYLKSLVELGFVFRLRSYDGTAPDTAVTRFFPALLPFALPEAMWWRRLENYFFSAYQNTLPQLALFIVAALTFFVGRHIWLNARMRWARQGIPLVLGGWGTRGKSGTERLKAAMISGLGFGLISKTTGCEAMFLTADPFGGVREMFLFRPYDKATIWEQANIVRLARKLGTDVFLWECMGLTPAYVKVLQRHWMRDDISTITNTYPDHEDVQGPAGRNIPEVMTNFIPERGTLLTTEEQMRPILADAARGLGTRMVGVGWLDAGLLPSDALRRFPYEEHPFNIALVLALADELGVDRDFALKEMADRVVADLGVLKTYPETWVGTRRLEFVNGMSANERFGALGNWTRMGFDAQDPEAEPGVWITTVVNNRADRVPRSRVFASILANDISADRHFLIGSNLEGLQGYIDEAWNRQAESLTLWPDTGTGVPADPSATLEAAARRLRVPRDDAQAAAILRAMLEGQPRSLDVDGLVGLIDRPEELAHALETAGVAEGPAIIEHLNATRAVAAEYRELAGRIAAGGDRKTLDALFAERLGTWFRRKIVVVIDYYATGDAIVDRIRAETPPGFRNRIMGMQNIKGTGLDFVYRWQAWDACHLACRRAGSDDPATVAEGIRALASFQEFGLLSEKAVGEAVARLRESPWSQDEDLQAQLGLVEANLGRQLAEVREKMAMARSTGPWIKVVGAIEAFLDAGDAVRRRRKADRIYRDMTMERISHERAALELKKLNARQKGGWLAEDVQALVRRLWPRRREASP